LRQGPRSSETCSRDADMEQGPRQGRRGADMEGRDPRAGSPKEGRKSSPVARSMGADTRREDLKG
jgi:hypothetical protein